MAEHPLLEALSKWVGRGPTQQAFEKKGFLVHKSWQSRIIQFCGDEKSDLLNRYWDEVAMETIGSVGQGDPNARRFTIQPKYHSQFLDEIVAKIDFAEPPYRYPPPIRCLYEHRKRLRSDTEFRFDETVYFENLKRLEAERLAINAVGWTGKKRDAIPFLAMFAEKAGFVRHRNGYRRNGYRKTTSVGVVFETGVDLGGRGGNPDCGVALPVYLAIFHKDDPKLVFNLALFERIIPGFDRYFYSETASSHVLGMRAHIELFDIIATSFG